MIVTLLSILGAHSIALPLSPAFPAHELQYILDQSQASMLLSSAKFESKAQEVMREGLEVKPKHIKLDKLMGAHAQEKVVLEGAKDGEGGMMLYTSGTTNRPVSVKSIHNIQLAHSFSERSPTTPISNDSTSPVPHRSMDLLSVRSPPPRPPTTPYPRDHKRYLCAPLCRILNRVPIPLQCDRSVGAIRFALRLTFTISKIQTHHIFYCRAYSIQPPSILFLRALTGAENSRQKSNLPPTPPPQHLWLCRSAYAYKESLVRPLIRQCPPRALRHDRSRHGSLLRPPFLLSRRRLSRVAIA